jgi:hypothetical protein
VHSKRPQPITEAMQRVSFMNFVKDFISHAIRDTRPNVYS